MSDKWEDAGKVADSAGGGTFIRLKDDEDKVIGAFMGDPLPLELFHDGNKFMPYTAEHEAAKAKKVVHVKLNMAVISEGNGDDLPKGPPTMKILEVSGTTYRAIMKFRKKQKGFLNKWMEIERNGSKGDTSTTYSVQPDELITDEERDVIKELTLHDLAKEKQGDGSGPKEDFDSYDKKDEKKPAGKSAPEDSDGGVISKEEAGEIVPRLKKLAREDLGKFQSRFGINKVKALAKSDFDAAKAFIAEMEGGGEDEGKEDDDPFDD